MQHIQTYHLKSGFFTVNCNPAGYILSNTSLASWGIHLTSWNYLQLRTLIGF